MTNTLFKKSFFQTLRRYTFWPVACLAFSALALGMYMAFFASPLDYQQKETVRIMYVHVPASWLALGIYAFMGFAAIGGFVWRHSMGFLYARAAAPIGLTMTIISLMTGSIWGKPMWGTWWVWDARLTSMFVLGLLYMGYMLFVQTLSNDKKANERGAFLLILGLINLPIIKFSVEWWSTLHQPASVIRAGGSSIDSSMMNPLLLNALGLMGLCYVLGLLRAEILLMRHKIHRAFIIQSRAHFSVSKGEQHA